MPKNKNALLRFYYLDKLLKEGEHYSFEEILDRLNDFLDERGFEPVSERTLRDDFKYLRDQLNVPLKYDRGKDYYYYGKPGYSLFHNELSDEAVEAIYKATDILEPFRNLPVTNHLFKILESATRFDEKELTYIVFPFLMLDHNPHYQGLEWMDDLYEAMENNQKVFIDYDSFDGDWDFDSKVRPYFLKEYNNRWFLIGKVEKAEEPFWTIPLDRIHSIKILDESFDPYEKESIVQMFDEVIGATYIKEEPLQTIELFVRNPGANYVRTKPLHRSQKILDITDEGILLSIRVRKNYELLQAILQYVPNIRVVKPYDLHRKLIEMLEEGLEFMKNG